MLDRVLNKRQEHHRRHRSICDLAGNVTPRLEPTTHADHLNGEIRFGERHLACDGRAPPAHLRQRVGEVCDEVVDHRSTGAAVGRVKQLDVRERVEQEVRLDLRLEPQQLRLERALLELHAFGFQLAHFGFGVAPPAQVDLNDRKKRRQDQVPGPRRHEKFADAGRLIQE